MDKQEAEQRAQELLDFYGSGKYKGYEEITMPDGRPGIRVTAFTQWQEATAVKIREALPDIPVYTAIPGGTMSEQDDSWRTYPVRVMIPMHLHTRLIDAIGHRAMRLVGENHPKRNKIVSDAEDLRAMRQAKAEALQEAIEDWLAKPKDAKWR